MNRIDTMALNAWMERDKQMSVYEYHVSGHYMDGFRDGYAAAVAELRSEKCAYWLVDSAYPEVVTNQSIADWLEREES